MNILIRVSEGFALTTKNPVIKVVLGEEHNVFEIDIEKAILESLDRVQQFQVKTVDARARFLEFWTKYGKKQGKAGAWKAWTKLKPTEQSALIGALDNWLKHNPDIKFRPMPQTFINGRRWEDEFGDPNQSKMNFDNRPSWAKANTWGDQ